MTQVALPLHSTDGSPFDAIKHVDPDGSEWWSARELMPLLEYARWDAFLAIVEKAKASLALVEGPEAAALNFLDTKKVSGARGPAGNDYRLTRFGAYLTAMAGDDTKDAVAHARVYFAIKTREAEVAPARRDYSELDINDPHAVILLARAAERSAARAIEMAERAERAEGALAIAAPKAAQADFHRAADGLVAIGDFANKVKAWAKGTHGVRVLHQDVWNFLGDINLLIRGNTLRKNQPTAFAVERDFIRVSEGEHATNHGTETHATPRLTPTGEGYAWDRAVKRIADHGSLAPTTAVAIPTQSLPSERS